MPTLTQNNETFDFKQATPKDQLRVLLMAADGAISNLADGTTTSAEDTVKKLMRLISGMQIVVPLVGDGKWPNV